MKWRTIKVALVLALCLFGILRRSRHSLVALVHVGMPISEVRQLLKPMTLDTGTAFINSSDTYRVYIQIAPAEQVYFDIDGRAGDPFVEGPVVRVGPVEPKTIWTRHAGGSIRTERETSKPQLMRR